VIFVFSFINLNGSVHQVDILLDMMVIGQLIIMPCYNVFFREVDELEDTDRGAGGFGSTGMM
jgi:dUTPase